jgi:hypothetical protein
MKLSLVMKRQAVEVAWRVNGLYELLSALKLVCENLDLSKVNQRTRHFKDLRFTFLGLLVRASGILQRLILRAEALESVSSRFLSLSKELKSFQYILGDACKHAQNNNIARASVEVIEAAEQFNKVKFRMDESIRKNMTYF